MGELGCNHGLATVVRDSGGAAVVCNSGQAEVGCTGRLDTAWCAGAPAGQNGQTDTTPDQVS